MRSGCCPQAVQKCSEIWFGVEVCIGIVFVCEVYGRWWLLNSWIWTSPAFGHRQHRDSLMRLPRLEFACDGRENSLPDPKNAWEGGTQPSNGGWSRWNQEFAIHGWNHGLNYRQRFEWSDWRSDMRFARREWVTLVRMCHDTCLNMPGFAASIQPCGHFGNSIPEIFLLPKALVEITHITPIFSIEFMNFNRIWHVLLTFWLACFQQTTLGNAACRSNNKGLSGLNHFHSPFAKWDDDSKVGNLFIVLASWNHNKEKTNCWSTHRCWLWSHFVWLSHHQSASNLTSLGRCSFWWC